MELKELLSGCKKSESGAQEGLFELYKDSMMGVCMRYSKNENQASGILKEGFVAVFRDFRNAPEQNLFPDWLKTKIIDTALDVLRRNRQEYKIVSTINAYDVIRQQDNVRDEEIMPAMENEDVLRAMQALSPAYRVVVNMRLVDHWSFEKIADKLDVGEVTIALNFEKAMYQLRKNIVQLTSLTRAE
jgi:RNA polymerase sigma-70 factor (ECF subfamily)